MSSQHDEGHPTIGLGGDGLNGEVVGRVGPYEVIRRLGSGGMGAVFLAHQSEPVERQVAVKLIRGDLRSSTTQARFELEYQALARMRHPAIAQVYDAGTTDDGAAYFVMEYVPGEPITEYCDRVQLPVRQRLELFRRVCDAIHHAHQKGILHRDLKPQNVLVDSTGSAPVVKVIDFGLAKIFGPDAREALTVDAASVLGTPAYMSPEQINPKLAPDVDTRSDVYALGVLLYELLVGHLPVEGSGDVDMLLRVAEGELIEPNRRLASSGELEEIARRRGVEKRQILREISGEPSWIMLKALEHDRERRYPAVLELEADIERFLQRRPVKARQLTFPYWLRKLVQRNKRMVAAATVAVLALTLGTIGTTFGMLRSLEAERRAASEAATASFVKEFLQEVLAAPNPTADGREVRVVDVLERASERIDEVGAERPEMEAEVRLVLASTFIGLGELEAAEPHVERAVTLYRDVSGQTLDNLARATFMRARLLHLLGRGAEAERAARESLTLAGGIDSASEHAFRAMTELAMTLTEYGEVEEGEQLARLAVTRLDEGFGSPDGLTRRARMILGIALVRQGRYSEAESVARRLVGDCEAAVGEQHPATLEAINLLSGTLYYQGAFEELEPVMRQMVDLKRAMLGPDHPATLDAMHNLAIVLSDTGRDAQALPLIEATIAARRQVLGPEHPKTLDSRTVRAQALNDLGRSQEVRSDLQPALAEAEMALGPNHRLTLMVVSRLARAARLLEDFEEAERLSRRLLEGRRATLGDHPDTMSALAALAQDLIAQERATEAEPLLREAVAGRQRHLGPTSPDTVAVVSLLAECLVRQGKAQEALAVTGTLVDDAARELGDESTEVAELRDVWQRARASVPSEQPLDEP